MSSDNLPYFNPAEHPLAGRINDITKRLERVEDVLLPLEPLYPLELSARLLCINMNRLRAFLSKNRHLFLPRYLSFGPNHTKHRYLTADEIRRIRRSIFRGPGVVDL